MLSKFSVICVYGSQWQIHKMITQLLFPVNLHKCGEKKQCYSQSIVKLTNHAARQIDPWCYLPHYNWVISRLFGLKLAPFCANDPNNSKYKAAAEIATCRRILICPQKVYGNKWAFIRPVTVRFICQSLYLIITRMHILQIIIYSSNFISLIIQGDSHMLLIHPHYH